MGRLSARICIYGLFNLTLSSTRLVVVLTLLVYKVKLCTNLNIVGSYIQQVAHLGRLHVSLSTDRLTRIVYSPRYFTLSASGSVVYVPRFGSEQYENYPTVFRRRYL